MVGGDCGNRAGRRAPTLPMLPGTPERATHDYGGNGTSSLYATLNVGSGKVINSLHQRHRTIEFLKFPKTIDAPCPRTSTSLRRLRFIAAESYGATGPDAIWRRLIGASVETTSEPHQVTRAPREAHLTSSSPRSRSDVELAGPRERPTGHPRMLQGAGRARQRLWELMDQQHRRA